jgi:hypothetical protein
LPLPPLLVLDEIADLAIEGGPFGMGGATRRMALH